MRFPAIELLQHRLLDRDGQDEFPVVRAELHLVDEPFLVLVARLSHALRRDVIDGQRQLLVFVVLVEVAVGEVSAPLGSYHLSHQLHGGVVLATVATGLSPDVNPGQLLGAIEPLRGVLVDIRVQLRISRYAQQQREEQKDVVNPALHQPHSHPSRGGHS